MSKKPIIKTTEQIAHIRQAGTLLNELLVLTAHKAQPGVTLLFLEECAQDFLDTHKVSGSFKGFEGFPANLCLSLNDCVVHGIPNQTILKKGDVLKIDAGVTYQGYVADAAVTIIIGGKKENNTGAKLITATKTALDKGIQQVRPGQTCIGYAQTVYKTLVQHNVSVLRNLTGHGVGVEVHETPHLYNWPHQSMYEMKWTPGRVVALEPITAIKSTNFTTKPGNDRNLYTTKGDLGAQREYTLVIHDDDIEILAGIEDENILYA